MTNENKKLALKNKNLPAFPTEYSYADEDFIGQPVISKMKYPGITKREYFLSKALQAFISKYGPIDYCVEDAERLINAVDLTIELSK